MMSMSSAGTVALAPTDWGSRLRIGLIGIVPALFVAQLVFGAVRTLSDGAGFVAQFAAAALSAVGVIAVSAYVNARRYPTPLADFSARRLIVGARSIAFAEIDEARYTVTQVKWGRHKGILRIGRARAQGSKPFTAAIPLPFLDLGPADDLRQAALLVVLDASSIRLPVDPYDPTGRFASVSSPDGHLDKNTAITLVENPGEELPS